MQESVFSSPMRSLKASFRSGYSRSGLFGLSLLPLAACGGGGGGGGGGGASGPTPPSPPGGGPQPPDGGPQPPPPPPSFGLLIESETPGRSAWRAGESVHWTITLGEAVQVGSVSASDFRFSVITGTVSSGQPQPAGGAFVLNPAQTDGEAVGSDMERRLLGVESISALEVSEGTASVFVLSSAPITAESIRTGTVMLGIASGAQVTKRDGSEVLLGASSGTASIEASVDTESPVLEGVSRPETAIVAGESATITATFSGLAEADLQGKITASDFMATPDIEISTDASSGALIVAISGVVAADKDSDDIALSFNAVDAAGNGLAISPSIDGDLRSKISVNAVPEAEGFSSLFLLKEGVFARIFTFTDSDSEDTLDYSVSINWIESGESIDSSESASYSSESGALDTDGDSVTVTFQGSEGLEELEIVRLSGGRLHFFAQSLPGGNYEFSVEASDGKGGQALQHFIVSVETSPYSSAGRFTGLVGEALAQSFSFADEDGDSVSMSIRGVSPSGVSFVDDTLDISESIALGGGVSLSRESYAGLSFSGTPSEAGVWSVTLTVSDGDFASAQEFLLVVSEADAEMVSPGFALGGEAAGDYFGRSPLRAGDINGDGIDDFVIGAPYNDQKATSSGAVYVVYGQSGGLTGPIAGSELTAEQGFVILGAGRVSVLGARVSVIGDINGDGLDDIIAEGFRSPSYVIYGKSGDGTQFGAAEEADNTDDGEDNPTPTGRQVLDLSTTLDAAVGFTTNWGGILSITTLGHIRDFNGDGLDDLMVANPGYDTARGAVYVVYGAPTGQIGTVDFSSLGADGFALFGKSASDNLGSSISGAGDVNGDGIDDLIVGARQNDDGGYNAGAAYVIYGSNAGDPADIDLSSVSLGARGFAIQGQNERDYLGGVSGGGDVNGDGIDDLIVSAGSNDDGGVGAGAVYVIYGKAGGHSGVIEVAELTAEQGFVIQGSVVEGVGGGRFVGDLDGDGLDDLAISGSPFGYVIYGRPDGQFGVPVSHDHDGDASTPDLTRQVLEIEKLTNAQGFAISIFGPEPAGDLNNDGLDDLIFRSIRDGEISGGAEGTGAVYVLYGRADRRFGIDVKLDGQGTYIREGGTGKDSDNMDITYADLTSPERMVVFPDLRKEEREAGLVEDAVIPDVGRLAAGLGTSEDDVFTLASTTSGAGGGVLRHNGRGGTDTVAFTLAAGTLDFTEDTDGTGTADSVGNAYNRFDSIEILDLTDTGAQTVIVSRSGVEGLVGSRGGFEGTSAQTSLIVRTGSEDSLFLLEGVGVETSQWQAGSVVALDADGDDADENYVPYTLGNARILVAEGGATPAGVGGVRNTAPSVSGAPSGSGLLPKDVALSGEGYRFSFTDTDGGALRFFASLRIDGNEDGDFSDTGTDSVITSFALGTEGVSYHGVRFARTSAGENAVFLEGVPDRLGAWSLTITASDGIATIEEEFSLTVRVFAGFALGGEADNDSFGTSVSGAGDVNGDGIDDLIVGAPFNDTGADSAGAVYVVYGKRNGFSAPIDVSSLTAEQGFVLYRTDPSGRLGSSVSGTGDINGDGIDDLVVGAPRDNNDEENDGSAFVIFGKRGDGTQFGVAEIKNGNETGRQVLELEKAGVSNHGADFAVKGDDSNAGEEGSYALLGASISDAGDFNGDGIADTLMGAYGYGYMSSAYVIYGKAGGRTGTLDTASTREITVLPCNCNGESSQ